MLFAILYLPVDPWVRAFLGLGTLFLTTSAFTLAKCIRDAQETQSVVTRLDQARVDKILAEHDPFRTVVLTACRSVVDSAQTLASLTRKDIPWPGRARSARSRTPPTDAAVSVVGTGQRVVGTAVGQAVAVAGAVSSKVPSRRRRRHRPLPRRPVATVDRSRSRARPRATR